MDSNQSLHENKINVDQDKQRIYNETFRLIEEEVFMRKNPEYYHDRSHVQRGGFGHINTGIIPGKMEAVKFSYDLPLEAALRGTLERQKLFAKEFNKKSSKNRYSKR